MTEPKKTRPDIIIATQLGSFTRYVLSAPFGPTNKRHPRFTDDPEKAQRFFTAERAKEFTYRFPKDGRTYTTEIFAPAAAKK